MLNTDHRHYAEKNGNGDEVKTYHDGDVKASLSRALRATLDTIAVGVVIVSDDSRILHANQATRHMLNARSPIVSLGGRLGALHAGLTDELRQSIARAIQSRNCESGIGLPLVNRDMTAATAHIMPLNCGDSPAYPATPAVATIFVTSANTSSQADLSTVGRLFRLTPAESRLLRYLVAGTTLGEAAAALGVTEAAAKTHQCHIFSKVGVSRWTDLMVLIGHLLPPICIAQSA